MKTEVKLKIEETIPIILVICTIINALATLLKQFIGLSISHFINAIAIAGMAICGVVSFILMELGEKEDSQRKQEEKT